MDGATLEVGLAGGGPPLVLLHPGIADRRCWSAVTSLLEDRATVVTYDRRGHGLSAPSAEPFSHCDDLVEILRAIDAGPALIAGSSMGGGVAIDAALSEPDLIAGLLLVSPAVSGEPETPESELDDATLRLDGEIGAALEADDPEFANRLEAWLWLDGPAEPEGRVGDPARSELLEMNAVIFGHGGDYEGGESGLDAWSRLGEIQAPATVAWGDLDIPAIVKTCAGIAARMPGAETHVFEGTAHLPYMERPREFAEVVTGLLSRPRQES